MDVFLSYAREDREFVRTLHAKLVEQRRDAWVDWEDIPPTAEWLSEIYAGIAAADAFLYIISPDSAASETCRLELLEATRLQKRLIPILRREVDPRTLPDAVSVLNWVFFRASDDSDASFRTLLSALDTDIEWVHAHTRLLVRAIDWEKRGRDESVLLRGRELGDAERALATASPERLPAATPLQAQFVLLSRKASNRRRRSMVGAVFFGIVVASVLASAAWLFSRQRDVQHNLAAARALTTKAQLVRDQGANMYPLSLLLALESQRIAPSGEAERLIRQTLPLLPRAIGKLMHASPVTAVAFSPDGGSLATVADDDETVRVWDTARQTERYGIRHSVEWISGVAFAPNGDTLFTATTEGLTAWDVATRRQLWLAAGASRAALGPLAISADGASLAVGDSEGKVVVRRLADAHEETVGRHDSSVNDVAWSPDGRAVASASSDKTARVWKIGAGQIASLPHGNSVVSVAWSPTEKVIATGDWDGVVRVWDYEPIRERKRFDLKIPIRAVAFTLDGSRLLAAAADHTARLWDLASGIETARMTHGGDVEALAVSPNGRYLATGSKDKTATLWDIGGDEQVTRLAHPEDIVTGVAYSRDGMRLLTVCDRTVRLWDLTTRSELVRFFHDGRVRAASFASDDRSVVTAAETDATVGASGIVWDIPTARAVKQFALAVAPVGFSADGRYLATGDFAEGALIRETERGDVVSRISENVTDFFTHAIALSPTSRYLAATLSDGPTDYRTYVWSVEGRKQLCRFDHAGSADSLALAFSADESRLAGSGMADNAARVWEIDGCRETARIALAGPIVGIAFSPDGQSLATGSRDRTARVWTLPAATEVARLDCGGVVSSVAFSPDGRFVAAASSDRTAVLWRWHVDDDVAPQVCARVGRSLTQEEWREYVGDMPYHETCAGLTDPARNRPPTLRPKR